MKLPQNEFEEQANIDPPLELVGNNGHRREIVTRNDMPLSHLDHMTQSALDAVFRTTTQTYEEFLGSFSYLTDADVSPPANHGDGLEYSNPLILAPLPDTSAWTLMTETSSPGPAHVAGEDELEEEILIEGNENSSSNATQDSIPGRTLKLDNFVEDEGSQTGDEDEDDDLKCDLQSLGLDSGGYQSSFFGERNVDRKSAEVKSNNPEISEVEKACGLCHDELSNCNIKQTEEKSDNEDIVHEPSQKLETNLPDSDEELVYDAEQDLPNPGEICNDQSDLDEKKIANNRQMDYSAKMGDFHKILESMKDVSQSGLTEETISDEVQPFVLDENFDYDNVLLTPKFTQEEMSYLRSFQKQDT